MQNNVQIPPPVHRGRKPIYPPIIANMVPGEYRSFTKVNQQVSFYHAAKKMGRDPVYRRVNGEYRVYLRK